MKKILLLILVAMIFNIGYAQDVAPIKGYGFHKHDGFYLSMSLGPNFTSITNDVDDSNGSYTQNYTGTGALFDLKIGGAVNENLILHATLISSSMSGPKVESNNSSVKTSDNLQLGEAMIGGGFTYYMMPSNMFFSASAGMGNFSLMDSDTDINISTERGFSMQLKVGKEWWISKNWGFGIGVSYGSTNLTNNPSGGTVEKMNSSNWGILFNTTFN